jgi:hypothetical protein
MLLLIRYGGLFDRSAQPYYFPLQSGERDGLFYHRLIGLIDAHTVLIRAPDAGSHIRLGNLSLDHVLNTPERVAELELIYSMMPSFEANICPMSVRPQPQFLRNCTAV